MGHVFSAFSLAIIAPWVVLSILWMPFSAAICAVIARERGMSAGRYSLLGGLHAFLFLFPSFYLIVRMFGRTPSAWVAVGAYVILYLYWLVGPVIGGDAELARELEDIAMGDDQPSFIQYVPSAILQAVTWVNFGTWAGSLACLVLNERRRILSRVPDAEPDGADSIGPSMSYLLPFILLMLWSLFFYFVIAWHSFFE